MCIVYTEQCMLYKHIVADPGRGAKGVCPFLFVWFVILYWGCEYRHIHPLLPRPWLPLLLQIPGSTNERAKGVFGCVTWRQITPEGILTINNFRFAIYRLLWKHYIHFPSYFFQQLLGELKCSYGGKDVHAALCNFFANAAEKMVHLAEKYSSCKQIVGSFKALFEECTTEQKKQGYNLF